MKIIAGLGNPGRQYEKTRHNMGFDTIDLLAGRSGVSLGSVKFNALYGTGTVEGEKVVLMKPLSYMNLSGGPIREMVSFYKADPKTELIVICDDIDLDPGRIRIRLQGSAGGHNGLKDIISMLGTDSFIRVRVGIGAKPAGWDLADYVLSRIPSDQTEIIAQAIEDAARAVEKIICDGPEAAMNEFNRKKLS